MGFGITSQDKKEINDYKKLKFTLNFNHSDFELYWRFLAKVALGTGYFLFKDFFVENAKHEELSSIMNGPSKLNEEEQKKIQTKCYLDRWWFSYEEDKIAQNYKLYKEICKNIQGSIVLIIPQSNSLCFYVRVAGEYIGMAEVPVKTNWFLERYKGDIGHIIIITNKTFQQDPVKSLFKHLSKLVSVKK